MFNSNIRDDEDTNYGRVTAFTVTIMVQGLEALLHAYLHVNGADVIIYRLVHTLETMQRVFIM